MPTDESREHLIRQPHTSSDVRDAVPLEDLQSTAPTSFVTGDVTSRHIYAPIGAELMSPKHQENVKDTKNRANYSYASTSRLRPERIYAFWNDAWAAETLSCGLSLLVLGCLMTSLRYLEGYALIDMPLQISINTLVAIFAAIIKASLLLPVAECISQLKWLWFSRRKRLIDFDNFDFASRGHWGSFLLIFRLRGLHFATFGALITILAIAIDPFTQQIVHPVLCYRRLLDSVAEIPRANDLVGMGIHTGGGMATPDPGMSAAIYAGLLDSPQTVGFQCATGNCTFPAVSDTGEAYQTAGLDFERVDISREVKRLDANYWYLGNSSTTIGGPNLMQTLTSPNLNPFQNYWSEASDDGRLIMLQFEVLTLTVDWNCAGATNSTFSTCMKQFTAQCRLWPAVVTIGAQIELGKLQERTLSSLSLTQHNPPVAPYTTQLISNEVLRNGSWQSCQPSSTNSSATPIPVFNGTIWVPGATDKDPVISEWYAKDCVWTMDFDTGLALVGYFDSFFSNKTMAGAYGPSVPSASYGDTWVKSLFHNGTASLSTVEAFVGQLASSMTAYVRQNPARDLNPGYAYGDAIRTEAYVRVRWAWISFPASLVLLSIGFLAVTIWRTREAGLADPGKGAWKSSSLAVIFAGLDECDRQEYGRLQKKSQMLRCAGENKVSLTADMGCDSTWSFANIRSRTLRC